MLHVTFGKLERSSDTHTFETTEGNGTESCEMQRSVLKKDRYCLLIYCLFNDAVMSLGHVRRVELARRTMSCGWHFSVLGETTQIVGRIAKHEFKKQKTNNKE
jgi:hypothetical protein